MSRKRTKRQRLKSPHEGLWERLKALRIHSQTVWSGWRAFICSPVLFHMKVSRYGQSHGFWKNATWRYSLRDWSSFRESWVMQDAATIIPLTGYSRVSGSKRSVRLIDPPPFLVTRINSKFRLNSKFRSFDLLPISGPPGWRIFRVSGARRLIGRRGFHQRTRDFVKTEIRAIKSCLKARFL